MGYSVLLRRTGWKEREGDQHLPLQGKRINHSSARYRETAAFPPAEPCRETCRITPFLSEMKS